MNKENVEKLLAQLINSLCSLSSNNHSVHLNRDDLICVTLNHEGMISQNTISFDMRIVPVESCRERNGLIRYRYFKEFHVTTTRTVHPLLKHCGRLALIVLSAAFVVYMSHVLCTFIHNTPPPSNGDLSLSISIC